MSPTVAEEEDVSLTQHVEPLPRGTPVQPAMRVRVKGPCVQWPPTDPPVPYPEQRPGYQPNTRHLALFPMSPVGESRLCWDDSCFTTYDPGDRAAPPEGSFTFGYTLIPAVMVFVHGKFRAYCGRYVSLDSVGLVVATEGGLAMVDFGRTRGIALASDLEPVRVLPINSVGRGPPA